MDFIPIIMMTSIALFFIFKAKAFQRFMNSIFPGFIPSGNWYALGIRIGGIILLLGAIVSGLLI
ncbi:hypothetical protein FZW96_08010 [Bacillus sp. BGMRC 2118]|nr:hypothetical protein FZW96_08010 [Bacillus sp. BGMRC 2118]